MLTLRLAEYWESLLGMVFLLVVLLARTFLKTKNYRDRVKKGGS